MSVDLAPWLMGGGLALAGAAMLGYCARGVRRGRITPMLRTHRYEPYDRHREPKRFWASLIYNGAVGSMILLFGTAVAVAEIGKVRERPYRESCLSRQAKRTPDDVIAACDRWIARSGVRGFDLGLARATQTEAHAVLGRTREAALTRRAAIGAYGRSLSGFPEDSAAHWNIAMLLIAERELDQAGHALKAYVELEPERGNGWLELGLVELERGDLPAAITQLTRAIERLPGEARPLAARSIAHAFAGDRVRAAADLDAARKIDPTDALTGEAGRLFAADPRRATITSQTPR